MHRWLKPPRRFPPTREGWWFLGATLVVGGAAVNGGLNLMFLIFGMMLFLILASGVMSEVAIRSLTVTRRPPATIHAGSPYLMGLAVRNDKQRIPTFSLEVEDLIGGRPVERRCYYLKLPAGRTQETAYRHTLPRRGYQRVTGFRLSTRFPFGLIRKSRDVEAPLDLLIYPALVPVPDNLLPTTLATTGQRRTSRKSRSGDFHGLREYRTGDDPRDIHWRTSARRGRPFIRESEDETGRTALVVLDGEPAGSTAAAATGTPPPAPSPAFEAAVSMAASLAIALCKRGFQVGLDAPGAFLAPADGRDQLPAMLKALALTDAHAGRAGHDNATHARAGRAATCFRVTPSGATAQVSVTSDAAARSSA